jgi:hypothetical protein
MKKVLFLTVILINFISNAQVGIGTTSPHASAALEIETTNKGFLAPRVALTSNSDVATIASPATGLMIYNTATAGTSPNLVVPGYYYYSGSKWERLVTTTPDATIDFNTANPNTGTPTFTPNTPSSADYIYVSSVDASLWVWNGSAYVTYVAPASTAWNLANTTNDAGNNKTANIWRSGNIGIGMNNPTVPLEIQSTSVSPYVTTARFLAPSNTTAGNSTLLNFGVSASVGNCADWRYVYQSNGAASNRVDFGMSSYAAPMISYLNSGNVGIGTVAPSAKLHIQGIQATLGANASATMLRMSRPTWAGYKFGSAAQFNLGTYDDGVNPVHSKSRLDLALTNINDETTFTNVMTWLGSGNVGIGTTSPASRLDVSSGVTVANSIVNATGSINDYLQYNIQNTSTGTNAQSGYSATANNGSATTGFAWLGINNSNFNFPTSYNIGGANDVSFIGSGQDLYVANANNTKSIIFSTGKATTPFFNEQMRILNNGNVGIGNSSPSAKLVVQGVVGTGVMKLIAPSVSAGDNWWIGFGHGSTSTDANDRARIGAEIIAGGAGRLFFTTGPTGTQTRAMFIDESQRVGIGTSSPAQKLEVNSGALATPPIRLTQQTATNAATVSSTVTSAHNLVVGDNGDVLTVPYRKEFSPNNCNCASVVPFTLPANFTYFGVTDGNYAGTSQSNTTAADYYLPTVANARAAGHSYGDVVVVYRGSGWNSVVGTTNTDLPSNYSLAPGESLVFVLTPSKWKRVNTY